MFLSSTLNNLFFLFSFFFAQCWFIILPSSPPVSLQLNLSYINLLNLLLCVETVGAEGGASYCQRPPQECSPTVGLDHSQPCGLPVSLKHKEEKRGTLSAFLFIVGQQRVGSTRRGRLILHALSLSSSL